MAASHDMARRIRALETDLAFVKATHRAEIETLKQMLNDVHFHAFSPTTPSSKQSAYATSSRPLDSFAPLTPESLTDKALLVGDLLSSPIPGEAAKSRIPTTKAVALPSNAATTSEDSQGDLLDFHFDNSNTRSSGQPSFSSDIAPSQALPDYPIWPRIYTTLDPDPEQTPDDASDCPTTASPSISTEFGSIPDKDVDEQNARNTHETAVSEPGRANSPPSDTSLILAKHSDTEQQLPSRAHSKTVNVQVSRADHIRAALAVPTAIVTSPRAPAERVIYDDTTPSLRSHQARPPPGRRMVTYVDRDDMDLAWPTGPLQYGQA